jgi:hypothetical protein
MCTSAAHLHWHLVNMALESRHEAQTERDELLTLTLLYHGGSRHTPNILRAYSKASSLQALIFWLCFPPSSGPRTADHDRTRSTPQVTSYMFLTACPVVNVPVACDALSTAESVAQTCSIPSAASDVS